MIEKGDLVIKSDKHTARHRHRCAVRHSGSFGRYVLCGRTRKYPNDKRRTESMAQRKGVIACITSIGQGSMYG